MKGMKQFPSTATRFDQRVSISYDFPVLFGRHLLAPDNPLLANVLAGATASPATASSSLPQASICGAMPYRVAVFIDNGAASAFPSLTDDFSAYATAHAEVMQLVAPPFIVQGGEQAKTNDKVVMQVLETVWRHKLCRQSFILALGGGAVLDAVGFAAATAHRGVRLIRMPSTSLAQCDAGVGVKNGINLFSRKNFWGVFAPPFAVLNDYALLQGLAPRDLRAGLSEAIKVALVRDREAFLRIHAHKEELGRLEFPAVEPVLEECAIAHLEHIATSGDPFELGSARPLDFGHWLAHALEELSDGALRHGEAVSIGIALDSIYSTRAGMLPEHELTMIIETLAATGLPLTHPAFEAMERSVMEDALQAFREHLGGILHVTLLQKIGSKVEVNSIDMERMLSAKIELLERAAKLVKKP